MNFDNWLNNKEVMAHAVNPSHICDYPEKEESESQLISNLED